MLFELSWLKCNTNLGYLKFETGQRQNWKVQYFYYVYLFDVDRDYFIQIIYLFLPSYYGQTLHTATNESIGVKYIRIFLIIHLVHVWIYKNWLNLMILVHKCSIKLRHDNTDIIFLWKSRVNILLFRWYFLDPIHCSTFS